ncbi:unnamed protein product [Prorocentrum cordatum]|uniref:Uncharacterized protein n=1 Tax=Prorocentrum cordatum TaxID=2364126 RepID=A0ABN9RQ67_9DINO|nr:unnamed protein product [Polarella glacialis]
MVNLCMGMTLSRVSSAPPVACFSLWVRPRCGREKEAAAARDEGRYLAPASEKERVGWAKDSASGTNMTHASHVLLVHPMVAGSAEEQRAYEAQAIGRVRRWGQRRRVQVYRFVVQETPSRRTWLRHGTPPREAPGPRPAGPARARG